MGILDRKGTLEKGKDADIIIFNNDIEIQETSSKVTASPKNKKSINNELLLSCF